MYKLLRYQLLLAYRQRSELMYSVLFFLLIITLFPFAISPDKAVLSEIAVGVIWVAALLSTMLSATQLFANDFADGTLDQWLLSAHSAVGLVLIKTIAHWLMAGFPLLLLTPVCGAILYLPWDQTLILMLTLLLGTPYLSLMTTLAVAITVGLRQGGVLLALLLLPLYIPVLIFASSAVLAFSNGLPILPHFAILGALLLLAVSLVPIMVVQALRWAAR